MLKLFESVGRDVFAQNLPVEARYQLAFEAVAANCQRIRTQVPPVVKGAAVLCPPDPSAP
jgi:hypothetical protein